MFANALKLGVNLSKPSEDCAKIHTQLSTRYLYQLSTEKYYDTIESSVSMVQDLEPSFSVRKTAKSIGHEYFFYYKGHK